MKLKASQYLDGKKPRKFYITRPEIEVVHETQGIRKAIHNIQLHTFTERR